MIKSITRQLIISICFLTICLKSYGQTKTDSNNKVQQLIVYTVDTSKIAILPFDTTHHWIFKDSKQTDLTIDDLQKIEIILNECISSYNTELERQYNEAKAKNAKCYLYKTNYTIDLPRYKRQYEAVINSKGEKEVWINCFCQKLNINWKNKLVLIKDGGNCYFKLKINITSGRFYELMVNGEA